MTETKNEPKTETTSSPARGGTDKSTLFSIVAVVLSFAALVVSLFEALAVRAEQKADVWPYLEVSSGFSENGYSVRTVNKGVGPARLKTLEMSLDGKPYQSLDQMIVETVGEERAFSYELYRTSNPAPGVMSPDERAGLFEVPWTPVTRELAQIWAEDLDLTICYCSIYDDCWRSSLSLTEPEPVSSCKAVKPEN